MTTNVTLEDFNNICSIINDLSDDAICLVKIGFLSTKNLRTYDRLSTYLWFICTCLDLFDLYNIHKSHNISDNDEKEKRGLNELQRASVCKLLADFGFCAHDLVERSGRLQNTFGFLAAYFGLYKLFLKLK